MKVKKDDVHYLSFMGGGGKGVAYLGAIRALEAMKILPIDIFKPGRNQIKGISGASAGAITALFLAMGMTSQNIEQILSQPSTFNDFFDAPAMGRRRSVNYQNQPDEIFDSSQIVTDRNQAISGWAEAGITALAGVTNLGWLGDKNEPIVKKMLSDPKGYLYNILYDYGLFPGFKVRQFFQLIMSQYLEKKILRETGNIIGSGLNGGNISFQLFFKMTNVDLVITGTNITKQRPAVFSKTYTPDFPVAEAVAISMNLPILFKPILVQANVPTPPNPRADDYQGYWIDGGVLNNFPIHAFDNLQPPISQRYPELRPINPHVLGLKLIPGPNAPAPPGISAFFKSILETILYPANQGQIRTQEEASHTIDLFIYNLETTEFAPPDSKKGPPIQDAESKVRAYFAQ